MGRSNIVIFAGPNGAGKTTFSEYWLEDQDLVSVFVNADEFAQKLDPKLSETIRNRQAAKLMLKAIKDLTQKQESFALETTLASLTYARHIKDWQSIGYHVLLIYLALPNVEASLARVRSRVALGGHDIPEDIIRRRFTKSLDYLHNIYLSLVDEWYIYENLDRGHKILDQGIKK